MALTLFWFQALASNGLGLTMARREPGTSGPVRRTTILELLGFG